MLNEHAVHSALARPYHGHHRLIRQKAAALVHGIVSNHDFVDGNKRTAPALLELLVQRCGYEFLEEDDIVAATIIRVARRKMRYGDLAEWFRERIVRPTTPHEHG